MEKKRYSDVNEKNKSRTEEFKIQKDVMSEVSLIDIKQNKDGKSSLCEGYKKGSKSFFQKQQKST